jgi:hypothetical protein
MDNKLRILINQLVKEEISLFEKKLKKDKEKPEEELNLDIDIPAEEPSAEAPPTDTPPTDVPAEPNMDMSGGNDAEKRVGQALQQALDAAREMPDGENKNKLIRQIGNTALFFLKTQIPVDGNDA